MNKLTLVKTWLADYQLKWLENEVKKGRGTKSKSSIIRDLIDEAIQYNSK